MDKQTKGSWLIYQTGKLQQVTNQSCFETTYIAGKAGILLSAISQDNDGVIETSKLNALAQASGINRITELPYILQHLSTQGLVDLTQHGINVVGVTTTTCLQHTSDIFDSLAPSNIEQASIALCEEASTQPLLYSETSEKLSDIYQLASAEVRLLLDQSSEIGFVDSENIDTSTTLLFNGNLFRRDDVAKVNKVLTSLSSEEAEKQIYFSDFLTKNACVSMEDAKKILGENLFYKLASVGIYDINVVSNSTDEMAYITRPSAFSKFSNSMVDDAFDLAKMFVSALTYGMTRSYHYRGQIQQIELLMQTLIAGNPIGPVQAIGEDYKILEMKHVVEVFEGEKKGRHGHMMRLLKKEVGLLALEVIKNADVSQHSLSELPSAAINRFRGPESNRTDLRRRELGQHPNQTRDILLSLRTGRKNL